MFSSLGQIGKKKSQPEGLRLERVDVNDGLFGRRSPVDAVLLLPELLKSVELTYFVGHDVYHDVNVIENRPQSIRGTLGIDGFDVVLLTYFFIDTAEDSTQVRSGSGGADDGEVCDG